MSMEIKEIKEGNKLIKKWYYDLKFQPPDSVLFNYHKDMNLLYLGCKKFCDILPHSKEFTTGIECFQNAQKLTEHKASIMSSLTRFEQETVFAALLEAVRWLNKIEQ